jgi:nitroreductase
VLATAVASYIVLLGAHARGLAGYWRTVPVMETAAGRAALGLPADELPIGLLHLGDPRQEQRVPDRAPVEEIAFFLD